MVQRRMFWAAPQNRVVEALHALRRAGTEIVYIPGNHDRPARSLCGLMLPAMRVRRRAVHVTADGRRLLVVHGDDYDSMTQFGGMQERFGDWLYYRILTGNKLLNRSEEHTSELQSLMRISYAVFCMKKKKIKNKQTEKK